MLLEEGLEEELWSILRAVQVPGAVANPAHKDAIDRALACFRRGAIEMGDLYVRYRSAQQAFLAASKTLEEAQQAEQGLPIVEGESNSTARTRKQCLTDEIASLKTRAEELRTRMMKSSEGAQSGLLLLLASEAAMMLIESECAIAGTRNALTNLSQHAMAGGSATDCQGSFVDKLDHHLDSIQALLDRARLRVGKLRTR